MSVTRFAPGDGISEGGESSRKELEGFFGYFFKNFIYLFDLLFSPFTFNSVFFFVLSRLERKKKKINTKNDKYYGGKKNRSFPREFAFYVP